MYIYMHTTHTTQEHDTVECHLETRQAVVADRSFTFDYLYDQVRLFVFTSKHCILTKEPYILTKEPYMTTKEPYDDERALYSDERALYDNDRALHFDERA